ncbi:MAG TPA: aldo/keto reductase [Myxococcota bacterium]|nr:aldo/keto reductase [Myxococcota bacterium]
MNPLFAPRSPSTPAPLVLGCMNFGKRTPPAEARRIVERALASGLTLFDTANAYGDGESERLLGQLLTALPAADRDKVLVATKVGWWKREGLRKERVIASLDESLARLNREHVDLYYLHVPDHETPIEDTLEGIAAVLDSGKARHFGLSNYASWQILEVFLACDTMNIPRPAVSQQLYNLLIRQLDLEYLRFAKKYGVHTTVYNPLAGGLLTDKRPASPTAPNSSTPGRFHKNPLYQRRYLSDVFLAAADELEQLARHHNLTLVQLAFAFLVNRPGVDSVRSPHS